MNNILYAAISLAVLMVISLVYRSRKNKEKTDAGGNQQQKSGGGKSKSSSKKSPFIKGIFLLAIIGLAAYGLQRVWTHHVLSRSKAITEEMMRSSVPQETPTADQIKPTGGDFTVICYPGIPTEVMIPICRRFIYDGKGEKFSIKKQGGEWIPVGTDAPWVELGATNKVWIKSREKTPVAVDFHFTFYK